MGKNVTPKINVNSDDLTKKIGELIAMGLTAGMLDEISNVKSVTRDEYVALKEAERKQAIEDEITNPLVNLNHDDFQHILNEMMYIYVKKNADYGNSFDKSLDEDGLLVAKIRLGDKMNRFASLINGEQQVQDESIRDTLIDLANYAAMTVKWLDSKQNKGE